VPKPRALYATIADELRAQISSGELQPGDRLPSERDLIESYGASRTTIREAVRVLIGDGLIATSQGRGRGSVVRARRTLTYYATRAEDPGVPLESDAFFSEAIAQGLAPSQVISVKKSPLPTGVAELLGRTLGEQAVRRLCVRSINEVPNSLQDSWYPMDLAEAVPALLHRLDIKQGTTRYLAEQGYLQVAFLDQNTARMPTEEEKNLLGLGAGTPVLEHRRVGYTAVGTPVRVSVNVFAGDRSVVAYALGDAEGLPGTSR
jgi:DNA-binding GntR family transcriptional regulator